MKSINWKLALVPSIALAGAGIAVGLGGCASQTPAHCEDSPVSGQSIVNLNEKGVALDGHDPVAFFTQGKPVKGDPAIASTYKGATYWFASKEDKGTFDANPAKYEPQFGGFCAYAASINRISPVDVKYWEIVDGRLILQHNQKAWDLWHKDAKNNLVKADANWPGLVKTRCATGG